MNKIKTGDILIVTERKCGKLQPEVTPNSLHKVLKAGKTKTGADRYSVESEDGMKRTLNSERFNFRRGNDGLAKANPSIEEVSYTYNILYNTLYNLIVTDGFIMTEAKSLLDHLDGIDFTKRFRQQEKKNVKRQIAAVNQQLSIMKIKRQQKWGDDECFLEDLTRREIKRVEMASFQFYNAIKLEVGKICGADSDAISRIMKVSELIKQAIFQIEERVKHLKLFVIPTLANQFLEHKKPLEDLRGALIRILTTMPAYGTDTEPSIENYKNGVIQIFNEFVQLNELEECYGKYYATAPRR